MSASAAAFRGLRTDLKGSLDVRLSRRLPGASDRPEREPRRPPQPPPSREPARPGGISASIVKYLSCGAKAPSARGRWSSFGQSHPGRIDPMIGGAGGDSVGLAVPATVFKMFYSSGGGPSAGLAPDPFGIGFVCGDGGMRGGRRRITMGAVLAAKDSDFPISSIAFHEESSDQMIQ